jgi:hypothetical protein
MTVLLLGASIGTMFWRERRKNSRVPEPNAQAH